MRVTLKLDEQQTTDLYVGLRVAAWTANRKLDDASEDAENVRFREALIKLSDLLMDAAVEAARKPFRKGA